MATQPPDLTKQIQAEMLRNLKANLANPDAFDAKRAKRQARVQPADMPDVDDGDTD